MNLVAAKIAVYHVDRRSASGAGDAGAVLDPGTQPCYAAAMPEADSHPLVAPPSDPSSESVLHVRPVFAAVAAHRFDGPCNKFAMAVGFLSTFDDGDLASVTDVSRDLVVDRAFKPWAANSQLIEMPASPATAIAPGPVARPTCRIP
jgi:hypothetical protein